MAKKRSEGKEILWNVINSLLSGALVLIGAFSAGNIDRQALFVAVFIALGVALTKFKEYWDGEKGEYTCRMFKFL